MSEQDKVMLWVFAAGVSVGASVVAYVLLWFAVRKVRKERRNGCTKM